MGLTWDDDTDAAASERVTDRILAAFRACATANRHENRRAARTAIPARGVRRLRWRTWLCQVCGYWHAGRRAS